MHIDRGGYKKSACDFPVSNTLVEAAQSQITRHYVASYHPYECKHRKWITTPKAINLYGMLLKGSSYHFYNPKKCLHEVRA